jgi:hypothetical protein
LCARGDKSSPPSRAARERLASMACTPACLGCQPAPLVAHPEDRRACRSAPTEQVPSPTNGSCLQVQIPPAS